MKDSKKSNSALDFVEQLNIDSKNDFTRNSNEVAETSSLEYDEECYLEKIAEEECYKEADLYYIDCYFTEEPISFYNH